MENLENELIISSNLIISYASFFLSRGIVHGDVKLENVLLSEAGNLNSVKLSGMDMSDKSTRSLVYRI
jgi:serine/threonine protein kinase